jgi:hypothetical protein
MKIMTLIRCLLFLLVNLQVLPFMGEAGAAQAVYEKHPVLQASQVLPKGMQEQGELYKIDPEVPTDGFLMTFTVHSEYGVFTARTPETLEMLLVEIGALEQLKHVSQSDAFVEGFKDSSKQFGRQIKDLVTEPVETVKGIPAGVGSFFSRMAQGAKTGYQKLQDIQDENDQVAPPQPKGLGGSLPGKTDIIAEDKPGMSVEEASLRMTGQVTANAFGYEDQRRRIAREVRVDPYTTNPVLTEKLNHIAGAAFVGGLGISVFKAVAPVSMVLSTSTLLSDWVWDTTPGALKLQNEAALLAMGVTQDEIDHLLRHRFYTLTLQTKLVKALERLQNIEDRPQVMPVALSVESFDQARFVVSAMEMLAKYHETVTPLASLVEKVAFAAQTQTGLLVLAGPVDYLGWTQPLDRFISRPDLEQANRVILLRGTATPMAQAELAKKHWQLRSEF